MITKRNTRISLLIAASVTAACSFEPKVSYEADVKPIIDRHCISCHMQGGEGLEISGLELGSYEGLMKGTKFGPVVIAGDSLGSSLNILVEGRADESIRMPHKSGSELSEDEIRILKLWVDQGAKNN